MRLAHQDPHKEPHANAIIFDLIMFDRYQHRDILPHATRSSERQPDAAKPASGAAGRGKLARLEPTSPVR
jgi:hypothetical protein